MSRVALPATLERPDEREEAEKEEAASNSTLGCALQLSVVLNGTTLPPNHGLMWLTASAHASAYSAAEYRCSSFEAECSDARRRDLTLRTGSSSVPVR